MHSLGLAEAFEASDVHSIESRFPTVLGHFTKLFVRIIVSRCALEPSLCEVAGWCRKG